MKEYKVLREFEGLEVGDILKYDEEHDNFIFNRYVSDRNSSSSYTLSLSNGLVETYIKGGYLEPNSTLVEDKQDITHSKLRNLQDFIAKQKKFYQDRNERIQRKYDNGKLQSCVKVEHDTVYFNMMKLLNKIESITA